MNRTWAFTADFISLNVIESCKMYYEYLIVLEGTASLCTASYGAGIQYSFDRTRYTTRFNINEVFCM